MRRFLFLSVLSVVACTGRERPTTKTTEAPTALLARVRASSVAFGKFGATPSSDTLANISLPAYADSSATIGVDPSRTLTIRALDVAHVSASTVEGASVFVDAAAATDLLLAREADRFEEVRVLREGAPSSLRWSIEASDGIASMRVRGATVEALDREGHVVIRTTELFAVDNKGTRRAPVLSLQGRDRRFVLTATLDTRGLAYPIVHDPVWLAGPSMEFSRSGHRAVLAADGKVYVACGGVAALEVFDPGTSTFTTKAAAASMAVECAMSAATAGKIVVVGADETVNSYDIATNAWTAGATGTTSRYNAIVVALSDGRTIVTGGNAGSTALKSTDMYDPSTNSWTTKATMSSVRTSAAAVLLPSGKVLVAGGYDDVGTQLSSTEIYDPTANTWTAGPNLPAPVVRAAIAVVGTKAIVIGGSGSGGDSASTSVYDPATNTFTAGPALTVARSNAMTAVTPDGRLFVIGGSVGGGDMNLSAVDVADAALTKFTASAKTFLPRVYAHAIGLSDGRVLVTGGSSYMGAYSSTEILSAFAEGKPCTWGGECASGFCASGVCCNTACGGACERCDVAGKVGTCGAASAGTECGAAAACTGSTLSARGRCDGTATTCTTAAPTPCAGALLCADATSCLTKCTKDADCTTGGCDGVTGLCLVGSTDAGPAVAPVPEGSPKVLGSAQRCTNASECSTGFCVDGVCCDSECKEKCHSCALPSSPGRCTEEPLGVDLRSECGPALSCAGTCGKGGICTTSVAGSQCQPSTCTGATTGKGAAVCVATGVPCDVSNLVAFDCGSYICDPAFGACRTSCNESSACAPGFTCNATSKSCERLPPSEDEGCAVSAVGAHAQGGGVAIVALLIAAALTRRPSRSRRSS